MSGVLERLEAEAKKRNFKYFCFGAGDNLVWRQRLRRACPPTRFEPMDGSGFGADGLTVAEQEARARLTEGPVAWNSPWLVVVEMNPGLTAEILATTEGDLGDGG